MLGNGISVVRQRCEKCKWPPAPAHIPGLCNTLPPQHHPNTPCITSHPSTAATGTTGATACGPVEQTHRVYPTAEVTGGERLGEQWEGNTEEIEGRGETGVGGVASGAFRTLSLITQSFCHAKGRSTSFPPNQGISSEESLDRIVLRVSRWPFVCKAQICSVQHAFLCILPLCSRTHVSLDPAQTSALAAGQSE